jgi:hypothetical protein
MDSTWFVEDRAEGSSEEQHKAIEETKKALKNSTILTKRLDRILDAKLKKAYVDDEDFKQDDWRLNAIANASRRKTLREVKKLLDFK